MRCSHTILRTIVPLLLLSVTCGHTNATINTIIRDSRDGLQKLENSARLESADSIHLALIKKWLQIKDVRYIKHCPIIPVDILSNPAPIAKILQHLILADCALKGYAQNESSAYEHYFTAYQQAKSIQHQSLLVEVIKKIVEHLLFSGKDLDLVQEYIQEHRHLAYDLYENITNQYYAIRYQMEKAHQESKLYVKSIEEWNELISHCKNNNYLRLEIKIRSLFGIYLAKNNCDFEGAITQYIRSYKIASQFDSNYYQDIKFVSHSNMASLYLDSQDYEKALIELNKARNCSIENQKAKNVSRLYEWLSTCYSNLGRIDSAFYHIKLSHSFSEKSQTEMHSVAINNIKEKYQNERLTNDLSHAIIKRKKNYITSLYLGGLLSISLLGLAAMRRINRLKQVTLKQRIRETKQNGQLAAVNAQLDGEEQERKRVASALHDGIASHLTAASMHLQLVPPDAKHADATRIATDLIIEAAERTRKLSHELYPPVLTHHGLMAAIEALATNYTTQHLVFHLHKTDVPLVLTSDIETKIYYTIVEVMQNVIKHSGASECHIKTSFANQILVIQVVDNGVGIGTSSLSPGIGLSSISARMSNIGGKMHIKKNPSGGTIVQLHIPLSK